jgi:DNA-binding IclR family transcriptional regulator
MRNTREEGGPASVLGRALAVLEAFGAEDVELSLGALTARTGLAKTTALRLAGGLVDAGLLERLGHGYRLGIHLFELGERVPRQRELRQLALPFMEDLYEATHDVVHLAVLDGSEVLYFAKISGSRSSPLPTRVGGRQPAHCTALGKAILAYAGPAATAAVLEAGLPRVTAHTICSPRLFARQLTEARRAGYAVEREEVVLGNCCVAAPLLGPSGPVAAISVGGPLSRTDPTRLGPAVRTAALALSRQLASGRFVVEGPLAGGKLPA